MENDELMVRLASKVCVTTVFSRKAKAGPQVKAPRPLGDRGQQVLRKVKAAWKLQLLLDFKRFAPGQGRLSFKSKMLLL